MRPCIKWVGDGIFMFDLPKRTELRKLIPKKKIYDYFATEMNPARRKSFDADIARITIIHELSPQSINLAAGKEIAAIFIVQLQLRRENFDAKNIEFIARLFGQNLFFVLTYEEKSCLAIYQTRLLLGEWQQTAELSFELHGLDLDTAWQSIVLQVGAIHLQQGNTLDEQILLDEAKEKVKKQITQLKQKAWKEIQPRKKFALVQEIHKLERQLEEM